MDEGLVSAKLVAVTQPALHTPASNPESLVAFCARVSSPREYDSRGEDYSGLLKYCIKNKHWSVFEMANAVVEVRAPRDISRQLLRHRSFSFQEFSQRYSDDIEFAQRELRLQDDKNRQKSISADYTETPGFEDCAEEMEIVEEVVSSAYKKMREYNVAKETARVILPEGLTMSHLYVNGTLRSWIHYLEVRDDPGVTQWEHVLLAREIRKAIEPAFPTVLGMLNE